MTEGHSPSDDHPTAHHPTPDPDPTGTAEVADEQPTEIQPVAEPPTEIHPAAETTVDAGSPPRPADEVDETSPSGHVQQPAAEPRPAQDWQPGEEADPDQGAPTGLGPQAGQAPQPGPEPQPGPDAQAGQGPRPGGAPQTGEGPQPGQGPQPGYCQPGSGPQAGPEPQPGYGQTGPGPQPGQGPQAGPQPGYGQFGPQPQPGYGPPPGGVGGPGGPGGQWGQAAPYQQPPVSASDERTYALFAHLGGLLTSFIVPLIIYLLYKDRSPFLTRHGAQALNFQITLLIAYVAGGVLSFVVIGTLIIIAVWIVAIVFGIQASIAGYRGQEYRYPITIPFIKV